MATKMKQSQSNESKLEHLKNNLKDKFGDGFILNYTESVGIPRISTGIIALDKVLGGGIAVGRLTELFGKASSGKSTIILSIMVQAQRAFPDRTVVYIDAEKALDLEWVVKLGVDLNRFEHIIPNTAEQAFTAMEEFIKTGQISVIALDSVPASIPQVALEGEIGEANIGLQARLIASTLPRIVNGLGRLSDPPAVLLINQKRANLQSRGGFQGYEPVKSTGGMALPFYMTTRMDVTRIGTLKDALDDEIGQEVLVHIVKHKITPGPGAKITFRIVNTLGVDTPQELLDLALESGEIVKSGSWYVMPDKTKVQGEEQAKKWLSTNRG